MKILIIIFTITFFSNFIIAKGDLTKQKPITIEVNFQQDLNDSYYYEPSELVFETGKLYKLKLINKTDVKHYFTSNSFSNSIFTRKIQVLSKNKKIAEIKGKISEVEVFPFEEMEWWFVPIKTGVFDDLYCKILNKKNNLTHQEMGMIGKIIIK